MKVNYLEITQENLDVDAIKIDNPYGTATINLDSANKMVFGDANGSTRLDSLAVSTNYYTKTEINTKETSGITYLKGYSDQSEVDAINSACTYANGADSATFSSAVTYLKAYADSSETDAINSACTYANGADSAIFGSAVTYLKGYADVYKPSTVANSIQYTDGTNFFGNSALTYTGNQFQTPSLKVLGDITATAGIQVFSGSTLCNLMLDGDTGYLKIAIVI